jgi:hypothetical protein
MFTFAYQRPGAYVTQPEHDGQIFDSEQFREVPTLGDLCQRRSGEILQVLRIDTVDEDAS